MKILCLHGRGSNNEIFKMQTAAIRAELDDFEWVFVQGTVRHTEGNWSLYTSAFSNLPLYTYYNPVDPCSIIQTRLELERIIAADGPFDGVLSYSGGAALAAEILIAQDPFALAPLFRFAIFINGASPLRVFPLSSVSISPVAIDARPVIQQTEDMFLRPSALRHKDGVSAEDQADHAKLLALVRRFEGRMLTDGTVFLSDGEYGLCRWERQEPDEALLDLPTLHIRSTAEDEVDPHHGLHLLGLSEKSQAVEMHHEFGHDFPRGRSLMKQIAQHIRALAEESQSI